MVTNDRRSNRTLVLAAILAAVILGYEKLALTFTWFPNTISWYGRNYPVVKYGVLALIVAAGVVWLWHTSQPIER